jgi:hypothetical protein
VFWSLVIPPILSVLSSFTGTERLMFQKEVAAETRVVMTVSAVASPTVDESNRTGIWNKNGNNWTIDPEKKELRLYRIYLQTMSERAELVHVIALEPLDAGGPPTLECFDASVEDASVFVALRAYRSLGIAGLNTSRLNQDFAAVTFFPLASNFGPRNSKWLMNLSTTIHGRSKDGNLIVDLKTEKGRRSSFILGWQDGAPAFKPFSGTASPPKSATQ